MKPFSAVLHKDTTLFSPGLMYVMFKMSLSSLQTRKFKNNVWDYELELIIATRKNERDRVLFNCSLGLGSVRYNLGCCVGSEEE